MVELVSAHAVFHETDWVVYNGEGSACCLLRTLVGAGSR